MTTQARLVDDIKNLSGTLAALESYHKILISGHTLSRQAAAVMHTDLNQITKEWSLDQKVALEDFPMVAGGAPIASQPSTLANVTEKIGQVVERLKEILIELFEKARAEIDEVLNGMGNIQEKVKDAKVAVANMPIETGRSLTVDSGMMNFLSVDGDFGTGHLDLLARLAKVGSTVYPGVVTDFYDELAAVIKNYQPSTGAEEFIASIEQSTRPLEFLNKDETLYPGNQRLVMDEDGFSYGMAQDDSATSVDTPQDMQIRPKAVLGQQLIKILTVLEELELARDAEARMGESVKRLVEAAGSLSAKVEATKDANAINDGTKVVNAALSYAQKARPNNKSILKYVGRQLAAHLALIKLEAQTAILKVSA